MKRTAFKLCVLIAALSLVLNGCEGPHVGPDNPVSNFTNGFFVLNEGLFQLNNSTISFVSFDGQVKEDVFLAANHRGLGDTGSDLARYGDKIYVVVNVSETVEITDCNMKSLAQIRLSGKQPRRIAFYQGYAYVSCFDGSVVQIDTASLNITGFQRAGRNPDALCVCNGKLYVANSGGLDYPNYDNTVSVFDLNGFSFVKTITVGLNPTHIQCDDYGDVYVQSNGNYGDVGSAFQRIDSRTDEVVQTFDFGVTGFAIKGDLCYFYDYDYATAQSVVKVLDVSTEKIVNQQFISDGTNIKTPYGIDVTPDGSKIIITDAYNYTVSGDVYVFDFYGHCLMKKQVGLNPSTVLFMR